MADADRDSMLHEMAANRGCPLVKSRRRKPGDFGHGVNEFRLDSDLLRRDA